MGVRSPLLKSYGDDFAWSLLDATPDATLIVAGSGEIVFVNDHAGELFGFELAELLGRVVDDLLPEALRAVHRAHRTRYRAEPTVRAMGAGLELLARRSDGTEFPVEISLSPLHLDDDVFAVAAVRDVTERVAAEDQLHRVLRTLDATDDGVFIFDAVTLRFSFVNEGAVRLVSYRRDELLSMTPLHLNPYTTESEYRRLVDELFADGSSSLVRRSILLAKDGSEVPVEKTLALGERRPGWPPVGDHPGPGHQSPLGRRSGAAPESGRAARGRTGAGRRRGPGTDRPRLARHRDPTAVRRGSEPPGRTGRCR